MFLSNVTNTFNVTALTTLNGKSIFQCWALQPAFTFSNQQGTIGAQSLQLGNLANASYSIIPARFNAGQHTAPAVQWVVFLSGLAHITLPEASLPITNSSSLNSTQTFATEAWVVGGIYGTILALDVANASALGHNTAYPSGEETRALQIPTAGGQIPNHTIIDSTGPCTEGELVGRKRALIDELD